MSRDTRAEKKLKAVMRAEFGLKQRFERIDWEEDNLIPEVNKLKAGQSVLGLPAGAMFDIVIDDAKEGDKVSSPEQEWGDGEG